MTVIQAPAPTAFALWMEGTTAMTMLTEEYDFVIGGDPDRDTIDLAILDTKTGGDRAHRSIG